MANRKIAEFTGTRGTAKVYRDVEWHEYVVKLSGAPKADYHTSDKEDALETARRMAGFDPIRELERSAERAMENADTRGIECTHGVHLTDSCAECKRTVAADVRVGDAINGVIITRISTFDHTPLNVLRFYMESGPEREYRAYEVVKGHATQLDLKMAAALDSVRIPAITPERRRELDAAIERGEDVERCGCEHTKCEQMGFHMAGECRIPLRQHAARTTYGTKLCHQCVAVHEKRFLRS